jgi:hypothetical protein
MEVADDRGKVETLYYGSPRSSDFYRVYDKAAELKKKRIFTTAPWARVERHLKGRRLPEELRTVGGLLHHGDSFEPFSRIAVTARPAIEPVRLALWRTNGRNRRNVVYTAMILNAYGMTQARAMLRAEHRNPQEEFTLLDRALSELSISAPEIPSLDLLYQCGFVRQMWPRSPEASRSLDYNQCASRGESPLTSP